jgi:uncharacterized membrane protein YbaN (DUF454 family)
MQHEKRDATQSIDVLVARIPRARRGLYLSLGGLSLATGVAGMFVPILPTTCFLLFAAWCFGRSSPRAHAWMHTNSVFGRYLSDYRAGRGISLQIKVGSLAVLWLTICATVLFATTVLWLRLLLLLIAVLVTAHVATQRTSSPALAKTSAD